MSQNMAMSLVINLKEAEEEKGETRGESWDFELDFLLLRFFHLQQSKPERDVSSLIRSSSINCSLSSSTSLPRAIRVRRDLPLRRNSESKAELVEVLLVVEVEIVNVSSKTSSEGKRELALEVVKLRRKRKTRHQQDSTGGIFHRQIDGERRTIALVSVRRNGVAKISSVQSRKNG